ncbi:MAG: hypothetical protein ABJJ38_12820 [Roseibium sp.]|uniref:hypothetical protein n=1 Tax=Roseibium sp. TaxID=1936156 RepID=UPI00329A38EB
MLWLNRSFRSFRDLLPKNPLFRLLTINGVLGVAISGGLLAGVFWANIGNLRVLVTRSEDPVLPIVMLAVGFIITLTSVVMGSAIMMQGAKDGDGGKRNLNWPLALGAAHQSVPVSARADKRRAS